ncbi:50S ribosomal protein L23 [Erysipelothrix piscisicarius]|uniref:Large ribosomal subunit protein uL23 n=1 Tax=Erysipelothrix piscisicarius TaxID=2485784 RepID=A0A3Q8S2P1_9FIRM|nr:50S ribosomal protein L23 [Erysipelothrix piscisicarius]AZK44068.1 50S ribosomal protein L23 [Erysipelothrix piscisicarius]
MKRNPRDIIVRPIVTEKTVAMQQNDNKVTFEVAKGSNKIEIRQAIEEIFNVKVEKINVINVLPRKKRVGRYEGQTKAVRKAIVKLAEGSKIEVL